MPALPDLPPRSLEHPLPAGMRDLLPEEAAARRSLAARVLEVVALHGYGLVTLPVFEFAEVLERGLGTLDAGEVLRFVEPESGEVAALRPDMTPQIARVVATRLRDRPTPVRLAYEGTVVRRRGGRARKHRQIPQVGVELAGVVGPAGDVELLVLAAEAVRAVGLPSFVLDLGDAGVVRALLAGRPEAEQRALGEALAAKDEAAIDDPTLRALAALQGGRDAISEGLRVVRGTTATPAVERLAALFDAAERRGLGAHLQVDLGEVRGFAYYTGAIFRAYAPGASDAILSGGRYDDLLARFGAPLPAAGFAMDLDRAGEARAASGAGEPPRERVIVVGPPDDPRVDALRRAGTPAVAVAELAEARAYAKAWGFTRVLERGQESQRDA